jgi:hypothetical protein
MGLTTRFISLFILFTVSVSLAKRKYFILDLFVFFFVLHLSVSLSKYFILDLFVFFFVLFSTSSVAKYFFGKKKDILKRIY